MNREKLLHWGAMIALVTGLVGLGTALVTLYQASQRAAEAKAQAERDRAAYEHRIELLQDAAKRERICDQHFTTVEGINADFNDLYREHGQLMNAMRHCLRLPDPDDRGPCTLIVCAGAAVGTGGGSNCVDVAARAEALKQRVLGETDLARRDGCNVAASAAATYFDQTAP